MARDHKLILQQEVAAADSGGGYTRTWQDVATLWGAMQILRSGERLAAMQLSEAVTHEVWVRHMPSRAITTGHRLVWVTNGNKVLNIVAAPDPGHRAKCRRLYVTEGVAT